MFGKLAAALKGRSEQDWVRDIDAAAERHDWREASRCVRKAVSRHPRDAAILLRAALVSEKLGDHEAMFDHAGALVRLAPALWAARPLQLRALHHLGRYSEAIRAAAEAEELAAAAQAPVQARAELSLWQGLSQLRCLNTAAAQRHFLRSYELDGRSNIPLQLATYARVMEFRWPIDREALEPCAEASSTPHAVADVVYFFVAQDDAPHRSARGIDYFELMRLSAESARRAMPGVRVRLMTDRSTEAPAGVVDEVFRYDLPRDGLMAARLTANAAYLEGKEFARDSIFVDPAIYFLRDCRGAFAGEFDLAYTWRSDTIATMQDIMPLYAGVLLAPRGRGAPAAAFLRQCLACLEALERFPAVVDAYPQGVAQWWGDQLAPAAVVGWQQFYATVLPRVSDRIRVGGTVLRLLDADRYNYAVERLSREDLAGRCMVNFKGERKRTMAQFAQWYAG